MYYLTKNNSEIANPEFYLTNQYVVILETQTGDILTPVLFSCFPGHCMPRGHFQTWRYCFIFRLHKDFLNHPRRLIRNRHGWYRLVTRLDHPKFRCSKWLQTMLYHALKNAGRFPSGHPDRHLGAKKLTVMDSMTFARMGLRMHRSRVFTALKRKLT